MNKHRDLTTEIGEALEPRRTSPTANPAQAPIQPLHLDLDALRTNGGPRGMEFGSGGKTFDVGMFAQNIRNALDGNCVGYSYAINKGGALALRGAGGSAQLAADGSQRVAMAARKRMHTASVSKTITATAVLKAMDERGIKLRAKVKNYLPSQWDVPEELNFLRIRHLLRHRSGIRRQAADPHYSTLRDTIENLTDFDPNFDPEATRYDNRNFALFRVMLPYMVCPAIMANVEAKGWAAGDYHGAVDRETQRLYKMLVRHYVFDPLGLDVDCMPPENPNRVLCYMWPNPTQSAGQDGGDKTDEAGSEGWVLSTKHLAKFLRHRRYNDAFLDPDLREDMDDKQLGWLRIEGDHGTYLEHGGAYGGVSSAGNLVPGSGPVRTQIMQFPIQVEATVMVNSFVSSGSLDRIVANAFDAAWV